MKSSRTTFVTLASICCILFALLALPASAGKPKKAPPPPDMRKLIQSVDAKNQSIVIIAMHRKMLHTYRLDANTTIQVDGAPATFANIKAGMEVADATERDSDDLDAISLLSKTHAPVAPSKNAAAADVAGVDKTIQTVLPDSNSVVIFFAKSKLMRTYHIDDTTALKVNGVAGKFADIKPGMQVMDYLERDNDDLDSLTLSGYGDDDDTAKKK
jgi:hypothetical protein